MLTGFPKSFDDKQIKSVMSLLRPDDDIDVAFMNTVVAQCGVGKLHTSSTQKSLCDTLLDDDDLILHL